METGDPLHPHESTPVWETSWRRVASLEEMFTQADQHHEISSIYRALSEGRLVASAHPEGTGPVLADHLRLDSLAKARGQARGTLELDTVSWVRHTYEYETPEGPKTVHILSPEGHSPTGEEVLAMVLSEAFDQAEG